jgi:hypothetical protein
MCHPGTRSCPAVFSFSLPELLLLLLLSGGGDEEEEE